MELMSKINMVIIVIEKFVVSYMIVALPDALACHYIPSYYGLSVNEIMIGTVIVFVTRMFVLRRAAYHVVVK